MAILLPGRFIFLANPHTASLATADALATIDGTFRVGPHHIPLENLREGKVRVENESSIAKRPRVAELLQGDEEAVATVRNPYDWLVTCWLRRAKDMGNPSLREYAETIDDMSPGCYVRGGKIMWHKPCRTLRWETLQADLDIFIDSIGLERIDIGVRNVTQGKRPWREYFDREAYVAVNDRFGEDISRMGYEVLAA